MRLSKEDRTIRTAKIQIGVILTTKAILPNKITKTPNPIIFLTVFLATFF